MHKKLAIFPQDTIKKKSPVIINDRVGFDEIFNEEQTVSPLMLEKPDKRSPFGVANKEPSISKKEKDKQKHENSDRALKPVDDRLQKKNDAPPPPPRIIKAPEVVIKHPEKDTLQIFAPPKVTLSPRAADKDSTRAQTIKKPQAINYLAPKPRNFVNQDGLFILFLAIGAIFGWINIFHRKRFIQVLNAFFVTRIINQLVREENSLLQRVFVMVSVVFILILSIFVFQTAVFFNINLSAGGHVLLFTFCALGVSLVYFSKFLVLSFVSYLFDAEKLMKDYFYNIFLINNFIGVLLVPVVLLIAYGHFISDKTLIFFGLSLFFASFVYRIGRGVVIGLNESRYSIFHILLYLCTLEILPMILLIKIINQSIKF